MSHARIQEFRQLAADAAVDHMKELEETLRTLTFLAAQVTVGGEAYPVGVREIARRLERDRFSEIADTLQSLRERRS